MFDGSRRPVPRQAPRGNCSWSAGVGDATCSRLQNTPPGRSRSNTSLYSVRLRSRAADGESRSWTPLHRRSPAPRAAGRRDRAGRQTPASPRRTATAAARAWSRRSRAPSPLRSGRASLTNASSRPSPLPRSRTRAVSARAQPLHSASSSARTLHAPRPAIGTRSATAAHFEEVSWLLRECAVGIRRPAG